MREVLVECSHGVGHALLIAFDGEEVVGPAFLNDDPRRFGLGVQSVGGDEGTLDGGAAQEFLGGRDFVGAFGHGLAAQPAAALDGIGADDFQALAVEQFLTVDTVASNASSFTHGSVAQGESSLSYRARYRNGGVFGPFSAPFPWDLTLP